MLAIGRLSPIISGADFVSRAYGEFVNATRGRRRTICAAKSLRPFRYAPDFPCRLA